MKIGYARVSTQDQNLDSQKDALKKYGCEIIYEEKVSGKNIERTELGKLRDSVRKGDEIVVWKLDRLGRSLKDLIFLITSFQDKEIGFISLHDNINTTTAQGRLVFNIFASLAEFEREIIKERTIAGLESARARGRMGGRPKGLSDESYKTALAAKQLYDAKTLTIMEICKRLSISKPTLYKYLKYF